MLNMKLFLVAIFLPGLFSCASIEKFDLKGNDTDNNKLIFATVIHRHGDRNIKKENFEKYPKDPWKSVDNWSQGYGQLTKEGIRRLHRLGQFLRQRYNDLLGETYSFKKIYVQSSDYDRTIMSVQAALAGLFMPTETEKWNETILWQPIPVHTIPRNQDYMIAIKNNCPKYKQLISKYLNESKELQRIFTEHADEIALWSEKSGVNLTSTYDIYWLYNTIDIEKEQNKRIPEWAENATKRGGLMEYIAKYDSTLYADTPELARFASGFLIKEILEHFSQKVNSTLDPDRSLWIYSGHYYSIVNAMKSIGIYNEVHIPAYGSSLHFELYQSGVKEFNVQIFYRKSEETNLTALNIPECGALCPLNKFIDLCKKFLPTNDIETECRI